jgi:beta-lactamase class C
LPGIASLFALACLPPMAAAATPALSKPVTATEVAAEYGDYFRAQIGEEAITGAAFVIASPHGIVYIGTAGHTDTSRGRAVDENTVFRVASVSKTFAAGLTGLLVQDGRLSWDDRVVDHLPDFRVKGDSGQVRVRDLLGQSTGLIPHAYDNLIEDGLALEQIQPRFRELDYLCPPGECYTYQNSVFSLIQPIIEKTTAQSYAQLMEEKIFRPLDMRSASVGYEPFLASANRAEPHVKSRGAWKTVRVQPNYYRVAPAAGVNASARDMGQWLTAHLGGRPAVLAPELVHALTEPRVTTVRDTRRKHWRDLLTEAHYGLGWRIYRLGAHDIAYHSGWVSGYRADLAWSEELGIGIAVLMNAESNSISELTTGFWRMAFEQLPPAAASDPARRVATLTPTPP